MSEIRTYFSFTPTSIFSISPGRLYHFFLVAALLPFFSRQISFFLVNQIDDHKFPLPIHFLLLFVFLVVAFLSPLWFFSLSFFLWSQSSVRSRHHAGHFRKSLFLQHRSIYDDGQKDFPDPLHEIDFSLRPPSVSTSRSAYEKMAVLCWSEEDFQESYRHWICLHLLTGRPITPDDLG